MGHIKLDVRKTTPITKGEDEQIRAFSQPDSWEHEALERISPVPLRKGSAGAVVRALALLGMASVREHPDVTRELAVGCAELAAVRIHNESNPRLDEFVAVRLTMTRRPRLPTWVVLGPQDKPWAGSVACDDIGPILRDRYARTPVRSRL